MAHSSYAIAGSLLALAAIVAACGTPPPEPKDPNSIESIMATPTSAPKSSDTPSAGKDSLGEGRLNELQKEQMEDVLKRGARKVENCDEVVEACQPGESEVTIVFDGQKGKISDVLVTGPPFMGTPCEACIKRSFVNEVIMPFEGDPINVPYTIKITATKAAAADKGKKKK